VLLASKGVVAELGEGTMVTPSVRLVRPLRTGGMGAVWVAEHLGLKTEVVVKFIAPELADKAEVAARFEREAAAAAQVKSPHVVQVLDHGTNAEFGPYIVMELLEGQDLGTYLKANGRLPVREVAVMIGQVAKALGRAHSAGIIHRDIKPDNIFLCDAEGGEVFVKLLDFGIAKATDRIGGTQTTTGQVMGTPYYMSPEQLLGETIDARTDIWALGVCAFEAVTGTRPFRGETIGALTLQIHKDLPHASQLVPDVPVAFDEWFARCCAKDREARFSNARDAAQALYEVSQAAPGESKRLFSMRPPQLSLDLTSSPSLPDDGERPKTQLSSTAGVAPPSRRGKSGPFVVGGVLLLAGAIGVLAFFGRGAKVTADTTGVGGPTTTASSPTLVTPPPSAAVRAIAPPELPASAAVEARTEGPDAGVAAAAASTPSPASSSSATPLKVRTTGPRSHRPPRRPDGFDDIK